MAAQDPVEAARLTAKLQEIQDAAGTDKAHPFLAQLKSNALWIALVPVLTTAGAAAFQLWTTLEEASAVKASCALQPGAIGGACHKFLLEYEAMLKKHPEAVTANVLLSWMSLSAFAAIVSLVLLALLYTNMRKSIHRAKAVIDMLAEDWRFKERLERLDKYMPEEPEVQNLLLRLSGIEKTAEHLESAAELIKRHDAIFTTKDSRPRVLRARNVVSIEKTAQSVFCITASLFWLDQKTSHHQSLVTEIIDAVDSRQTEYRYLIVWPPLEQHQNPLIKRIPRVLRHVLDAALNRVFETEAQDENGAINGDNIATRLEAYSKNIVFRVLIEINGHTSCERLDWAPGELTELLAEQDSVDRKNVDTLVSKFYRNQWAKDSGAGRELLSRFERSRPGFPLPNDLVLLEKIDSADVPMLGGAPFGEGSRGNLSVLVMGAEDPESSTLDSSFDFMFFDEDQIGAFRKWWAPRWSAQ